ncbi:hypothetical protein CANINC_001817 [Pichia inconspicua]|uniref:Pyrimidine 5'-nucleotidase n=1 Tax=Pichia inconspicua TaxID=52247 RepID=A0A4T0X314_9ASCO|nr:hypothetical protein CANINC_001817 [[Candida] inconspicua]
MASTKADKDSPIAVANRITDETNLLSVPLKHDVSSVDLNNFDEDELKEREILILNRNQNMSQMTSNDEDTAAELHLKNNLPKVKFTYPDANVNTPPPISPNGKIFFFDIDNCLYKRSTRIHDLMQIYIHRYFKSHLKLNDKEASKLHTHYYKQYGLALEGLVRLHKVDAMEYNSLVDDALPLEQILVPNLSLRKMLLEMKNSGKVERMWLFTNAYKNHAERVIYLLGLGDIFDGVTFCDYNHFPLICKPMEKSFELALTQSGCETIDKNNIYFIDDSEINVKAARKFDWGHVIQYIELNSDLPEDINTYPALDIHIVRSILDLRNVVPELF